MYLSKPFIAMGMTASLLCSANAYVDKSFLPEVNENIIRDIICTCNQRAGLECSLYDYSHTATLVDANIGDDYDNSKKKKLFDHETCMEASGIDDVIYAFANFETALSEESKKALKGVKERGEDANIASVIKRLEMQRLKNSLKLSARR